MDCDGFLVLCGSPQQTQQLLQKSTLGAQLAAQINHAEAGDRWQSIVLRLETRITPWAMSYVGELSNCISGRIYTSAHSASPAASKDPQSTKLIKAYSQHGGGVQASLNGEFAFALRDHDADIIHAATDLFATRSLYFYQCGEVLAISDCCSAIIALLKPVLTLDQQSISAFMVPFAASCLDRGASFYQGLRTLRAGECLRIDLRQRSVRIDQVGIPADLLESGSQRTAGEAQEAILEALQAALSDRITNHRAALALSGGVDSALIAVALSELRRRDPKLHIEALTSVLRGAAGVEEARYAKLTASGTGIDLQCLDRDPGPVPWPLASPIPWAEEPMALYDDLSQVRTLNSLAMPAYSGMGADELIATAFRRPGRRRSLWARAKRRISRIAPNWRPTSSAIEINDDLVALLEDRLPAWVQPSLHAELPSTELDQQGEVSADRDWTDLLLPNSGFRTDVEASDGKGLFRAQVSLPFLDRRVVTAMLHPAVAQMDLDRWPQQLPKQCLRRILDAHIDRSVSRRRKTAAGQPVFQRFAGPEVENLPGLLTGIDQLQQFVRIEKLPVRHVDSPWTTLYPSLVCASLGAWFIHQSGVEEQWLITTKN